ncbi:acetyltransferase-like isoleucine patch superfamily enzyme [Arthrobacter sp. JUb119]|nr:acetyltransferase-like isoleucine patch superfamily enzyme [Arthrobacter sp. JUb119]
MRIQMSQLRPLLKSHRILMTVPGMKDFENTGSTCNPEAWISYQEDLALDPYTTFWGTSGTALPRMGAFSYTHSKLNKAISVGRFTSIAKGMTVMGAKHPLEWASTSPVFYNQRLLMRTYAADHGAELGTTKYGYTPGKISIGNDVWIGEKVTLGHGVAIGDGAVIASNSVVTSDVEPYTVVGGLPAKKIRDRFDAPTVQALQASQWWQYAPENLTHLDVANPAAFAQQVLEQAEAGTVRPFQTRPLTAKTIAEHLEALGTGTG